MHPDLPHSHWPSPSGLAVQAKSLIKSADCRLQRRSLNNGCTSHDPSNNIMTSFNGQTRNTRHTVLCITQAAGKIDAMPVLWEGLQHWEGCRTTQSAECMQECCHACFTKRCLSAANTLRRAPLLSLMNSTPPSSSTCMHNMNSHPTHPVDHIALPLPQDRTELI